MSPDLRIRKFNVREADWPADASVLADIRRLVFIVEQEVPQDEEWDGRDEDSWHFLAMAEDDAPIGTARLLPDGQIGRMAVLSPHRNAGVGTVLLENAIDKARHLGFSQVFLHAQTHALTFYQRAGFVPDGEEFEEAGIPHRRMHLDLAPPEDNVHRKSAVESSLNIQVKQFDAREVSWDQYASVVVRLMRQAVFVGELGLPAATFVEDAIDTEAIHWIAEDESRQVIGGIRMTVDGTVGRLVVLPEHRRRGIAQSLLELSVAKAVRFGLPAVCAEVPSAVVPLYLKAGFTRVGGEFPAHGRAHQHLEQSLDPVTAEDVRSEDEREGADFSGSNITYELGRDDQLILLRREEDFRNIVLEMCRQATQSIRIYSPVLDHRTFDTTELMEACSTLARRNKYTFVHVLMHEPHRVVKNGHQLLEISRRLPSSIKFRVVHPELRHHSNEFIVVDDAGVIFRLDHEIYDGYARFQDVTEANRLGRQFLRAWESGLSDPNLRALGI